MASYGFNSIIKDGIYKGSTIKGLVKVYGNGFVLKLAQSYLIDDDVFAACGYKRK